jgi:hypothetical protein
MKKTKDIRLLSRSGRKNNPTEEAPIQFSARKLEMLKACERIIAKGVKHFFAVARALSIIREKRLYHIKGYKNFDAYCDNEWGITRQRASQLILALRTQQELSTDVVKKVTLKNEAVARRYRAMDDEAKGRIKKVAEEGGDVSSAIIKEATETEVERLSRVVSSLLNMLTKFNIAEEVIYQTLEGRAT